MMHMHTHSTDNLRALGLLAAVMLWAAPAFAQDFQFDLSMPRPVLANDLP
jgi:hypothetical protein